MLFTSRDLQNRNIQPEIFIYIYIYIYIYIHEYILIIYMGIYMNL